MTEKRFGETAVSQPTVGREQAGMQRARRISRRAARSTLAGSAWPIRKPTYSWWYVGNTNVASTHVDSKFFQPYLIFGCLSYLSGSLAHWLTGSFLLTLGAGGDRYDLLYRSGQRCFVLGAISSRTCDTH